uniref:EGF-like domain-containing protein n=1 Tax=Seriola lalandi dorsalis TaxID=1841481 RepID=A0A3B4YAZ2_SERLL
MFSDTILCLFLFKCITLLICAVFLCGLEEADLSRSGHCAGTRCLVLFREPMDFPGAQKCCKNEGGELSSVDLGQPQETLRSLLGELSGSFWVEPMKGTGVKTGEAASGPRNCSSKLDGFLCRFSFEEPCGSLLAGGDVQVGAEDPDSMHVCFGGKWFHAPWNCEVMGGGCEHNCLDVDECKEQDPCKGVGMGCENKQGGFECKCKDGFVEEDKVCVDVSICDKCEHMKCNKHDGIYRCECHEGFRVSPKNATLCEQYCTERDCLADCVVTRDGGKVREQCRCPDGYITDVKNNTTFCTDINECEHYHMCDHTCENLFGSYRCSCDEGYELVEGHTCVQTETDEGSGSGSSTPQPTPAGSSPAAVPSYIKTGSVLGITVFMLLCAVLLFCSVRYVAKRCDGEQRCAQSSGG